MKMSKGLLNIGLEALVLLKLLNGKYELENLLENYSELDSDCFSDNECQEVFNWIKKKYDTKELSKYKRIQVPFAIEMKGYFKKIEKKYLLLDTPITETSDIIISLIEFKKRREIYKISQKIADLSHEEIPIELVYNKIESEIYKITNGKEENRKTFFNAEEACILSHKEIIKIENGEEIFDNLKTGFEGINLQKQHLSIVGAETSKGKTSFALSIGNNLIKQNKKVLIISLEMIASEIIRKLIALNSYISTNSLKRKLTKNQKEAYDKTLSKLMNYNCLIEDKRGMTPIDVILKARRHAKEMNGVDLIIIDYLQNMKFEGKENHYLQLGNAVLMLRDLAQELNCHVMVLSQFNRGDNKRENDKPQIRNIRGSGRIEEIADEVFLPYRPEYGQYQKFENAEIIIAKGRTSGIGKVNCKFYPQIQLWQDTTKKIININD